MRVEGELPLAPQHGRSAPSWGEPSLPIKGPLNDILAQRLVKDVQNRMEKLMSEPKKSKNISIPEQDMYMDQSQAQLDYLTQHKGNYFFA